MPRLNKILGFLAVGFVLAFLGKISKVDLYKAYFKTIAEYEFRNTQGLQNPQDVLQLTVAKSTVSDNKLEFQSFCGDSADILEIAIGLTENENWLLPVSSDIITKTSVDNCPIRGPTCA